MKKSLIRAFHGVVLGAVFLASSIPAHATFPGKNGRIAFVAGPDIYTMNPDGSDVKQLTNLGPDSGALWESWSPDGKQIVFNEYRPPDFLGQLWLMNADGTNQHLLLAEADFDEERPSFSSDGSSVIFTRCQDHDTCALFQLEVDGTGLHAITQLELAIQDYSAEYSFDGRLAFTGVGHNGIICAIELMDRQDGNLRRLTPAPLAARQPDWSPDGRRIAFSTHCRGFEGNPENEEIWVVNTKGDALHRVTRNGDQYFSGPHDFHPSWSPQGDAIVFERDAPDFSNSGIFIVKSDGSGSKKIISLGRSPRAGTLQRPRGQKLGSSAAQRRLNQIEAGGALPQWGPAAN